MHLLLIILMIIPAAIFCYYVEDWFEKYDSNEKRNPYGVKDRLLRGPGHYVIGEVKEIEFKLTFRVLIAMSIPLVIGGGLGVFHPASFKLANLYIWLILSAIVLVYLVKRMRELLDEKANWYLGYVGESAVAEELNKLMRKGWYVYHDYYPQEKIGNIDHIVIAPTGVYCVETKCPRQGGAKAGRPDWRITYSKGVLIRPKGKDIWGEDLKQVDRAVAALDDVLKKELGGKIPVRGILTYPFWDVYLTEKIPSKAPIRVLKPSGIGVSVERDGDRVLDEHKMEQIAGHIEKICKDVKP